MTHSMKRAGIGILAAVVLTFTQSACTKRPAASTPAVSQVAPQFAAQARTFSEVTRLLAGTWTLKQRTNPDGTPYRSKLEGVTYIAMTAKSAETLGPHVVATLYARESGIADTAFFNYPREIAGKEFNVESSGTWLIHNVRSLDAGAEVSVRSYSMAKGNLPPYNNGVVLSADVRYDLLRGVAGPEMKAIRINPGELSDLAGARIDPGLMANGCCGMTSLTVGEDRMQIGWSNKGSDLWLRTDKAVPAAFR